MFGMLLGILGILGVFSASNAHAAPRWDGGQVIFDTPRSSQISTVGKRRSRSRRARRARARSSRRARARSSRRARARSSRRARARSSRRARARSSRRARARASRRARARRSRSRRRARTRSAANPRVNNSVQRSRRKSVKPRTKKKVASAASAVLRNKPRKSTRKSKNIGKVKSLALAKSNRKIKRSRKRTPVQVVVSIPNQRVDVFRGTKRIASSPVSTGKAGHRTPTGVFSIIQKNRRHFSNLYNSAPMPYMQRITWSGIALHAGRIPGYPASHGCIRLPYSFARKLFNYTKMGAHVIVQRGRGKPTLISHDKLFTVEPTASPMVAKYPVQSVSANSLSAEDTLVKKAVYSTSANSTTLASVKKSSDPIRVLITRTTKREKVRAVEVLLKELGYEPGLTDGMWSRRSSFAVRLFQEDMELPVSGVYSEALLERLQQMTGRRLVSSGHIYVRQKYLDLFDAPIEIEETKGKLGTHLFTAVNVDESGEQETSWSATTVRESGGTKRVKVRYRDRRGRKRVKYVRKSFGRMSAQDALGKVKIPEKIRRRINKILTQGSSVIISDYSYSFETGKGTDFVVLTK